MSTSDRGREFARLVAVELSAEGRRRHITQAGIAQAAGISAEQMSFYVHGRKGAMATSTLLAAAEFLGISPRTIVDRAYRALMDEHGPAGSDAPAARFVVDEGVTLPGTPARQATSERPRGQRQGARRAVARPSEN